MKKLILLFLFLITATFTYAQPVEMDDALRSSGRIYVVVVTIAIVFIGLALYLFSIDRRLKKIEKGK